MTPPRSDTRVTGDAEAHHSASSSDRDASNDGASPPPNPPESVPAPSSRGPDVFANTAIMESVVRFAAREGRMGDVYRICLVNRQGVSVANRILYSRIPGWVANEGRVPTECVRWVKWIDVRGKPTWIDPEWKPRPCTPKVIGRYRKTFRHLVNLHWSARDVDDGRFVSADVVFAPEGTGRKPVLTCRWRARFRTDATAEVINRALRLDNKMWAKFDTSVEILDLQIDHSVPISASFRAYFEHESPPAGASIGKMELVRLDVRPENHVSMVILAGLMAKYTGQNLDNLSVVTENVMSIHVAGSGFKDEIDAIVAYFPRVRTLHLHSATSKYGYHNLPTLINRLRTRTPLLENLRLSLHIGSHTIEDDPYMQAASWSHGTVKELTLDILSERDLMTNMNRGVYRIGRSIAGILHPTGAIKVYHGHETHAQGRFPATARLNYLFTACVLWMQSMSQLSPEQVLVVKALKRTDAPDLSLRADIERLVARHGGELTTRPSPSESGPLNAR